MPDKTGMVIFFNAGPIFHQEWHYFLAERQGLMATMSQSRDFCGGATGR